MTEIKEPEVRKYLLDKTGMISGHGGYYDVHAGMLANLIGIEKKYNKLNTGITIPQHLREEFLKWVPTLIVEIGSHNLVWTPTPIRLEFLGFLKELREGNGK